jgi:hypothetical protein
MNQETQRRHKRQSRSNDNARCGWGQTTALQNTNHSPLCVFWLNTDNESSEPAEVAVVRAPPPLPNSVPKTEQHGQVSSQRDTGNTGVECSNLTSAVLCLKKTPREVNKGQGRSRMPSQLPAFRRPGTKPQRKRKLDAWSKQRIQAPLRQATAQSPTDKNTAQKTEVQVLLVLFALRKVGTPKTRHAAMFPFIAQSTQKRRHTPSRLKSRKRSCGVFAPLNESRPLNWVLVPLPIISLVCWEPHTEPASWAN